MSTKHKHTDKATVQNLHYLVKQEKISLSPDYQRGAVWTRSQKQLLIDSLLNGIDIPKLYFREVSGKKFEYEVVDGQQRLRAISEFLDNVYRLSTDSDNVENHEVKNRDFSSLPTSLQMKLHNEQLDIVKLSSAYTDEDVEDMFLRLQNGTPLNAPEKRRAYAGNMRKVVAKLARSSVFKLCAFGNERFGHEDAAAKILHLMLAGRVTDIKPGAIRRTYASHTDITDSHPTVKRAAKAFRFLSKAFKKHASPKLKKYSAITLSYLIAEMMERYNIGDFAQRIGKHYLDFEQRRVENEELPEEKQDSSLAAFSDAARSDSVPDLEYRHKLLMKEFLLCIPELELKDPDRGFSQEQRLAVFNRDQGRCKECDKKCDEQDFHVDHVKSHKNGGKTKLSNARLLCPPCNLKKGSKDI